MSWLITDRESLRGTCYIEILPGRYRGKHWNAESVYFEEVPFGCLEPTIARHWPAYSHYAFNEINGYVWRKIIADLQTTGQAIAAGATTRELDGRIGFIFTPSRDGFLKNEVENLGELRNTIEDLTTWLTRQLESFEAVSVLGM
jgi:hypothetical protein